MIAPVNVKQRLAHAFDEQQATILAEVIHEAYSDLVRTSDFNELKEIVRDLAVSQQRTEQRVEELATAQQRTEVALQKLSRQVGGLSDRSCAVGEALLQAAEDALTGLGPSDVRHAPRSPQGGA